AGTAPIALGGRPDVPPALVPGIGGARAGVSGPHGSRTTAVSGAAGIPRTAAVPGAAGSGVRRAAESGVPAGPAEPEVGETGLWRGNRLSGRDRRDRVDDH